MQHLGRIPHWFCVLKVPSTPLSPPSPFEKSHICPWCLLWGIYSKFFDLFRLNLPLGNFLILNGRVCLISLVKLWKESHLAWPMKMEEIFQMKCLPLQMCGNVSLLMIQFETSTNSYILATRKSQPFLESFLLVVVHGGLTWMRIYCQV